MPKTYAARWVIAVLEKHGFIFISRKGSHAKYRAIRSGTVTTVIVPIHRQDIPYGAFHAVIRQSGLSKDDFG